MLTGKKFVKKHSSKGSITKEAKIEKRGKAIGKTLFATESFQNKATMRFAREHKYPDAQVTLNALVGSLVVLTAEVDLFARR